MLHFLKALPFPSNITGQGWSFQPSVIGGWILKIQERIVCIQKVTENGKQSLREKFITMLSSFFFLPFLLTLFNLTCLCLYMRMHMCATVYRWKPEGISSYFLTCVLQGWNSGHQALQRRPLPNEPFYQPRSIIFNYWHLWGIMSSSQ